MNNIDKNFGIGKQALSVLAFLPDTWSFSTSTDWIESDVRPWYNCRERGVVISLTSKNRKGVLHIAWFEHRNSDDICALKWETKHHYMNHPLEDENIWDVAYGGKDKTKYDVAYQVGYGETGKMANWIMEEFEKFYAAE